MELQVCMEFMSDIIFELGLNGINLSDVDAVRSSQDGESEEFAVHFLHLLL